MSQKSAQVAWTQSVVNNVLGWTAHIAPATCIAMFPKDGSARQFDREKFTPMIESVPELAALLPTRSRSKDVTTLFKRFPGGFAKFVGSNSIADVKSTAAKRLIIEEPDDCNLNLRGQGDAIKLLEERGKTFRDLKELIGGTPSIKGVSSIESEMALSDQNRWLVPCPDCGDHQALEWEQVRWQENAERRHEVFGHAQPETAVYVCASCGSCWDDAQKNRAVQHGHAEPQAPFRGVLGLYVNELYACWHNSRMQMMVERYLVAKHEEAKGNIDDLIVFWNAALGRAWEYAGQLAPERDLAERGLDYPALEVPAGGLVLTVGADIQHDRIAVILRAWGRGEESWLVLFDELPGNPIDRKDKVWNELDGVVFGKYRHASGAMLPVRAASVDAGDGTVADAVYHWVRSRTGRGIELMAIKGATNAEAEIFRRPAPSLDSAQRNTKAARHGLRPFMVGVSRAKDLLLGDKGPGRLGLEGDGPGRIHWYRDVRADYLEQFTAEVKVPVRGKAGKKVWQLKKSTRNEVLDAEIYALHAARALKVHTTREASWQALEAVIRQRSLLEPAAPGPETPPPATELPAEMPARPSRPAIELPAQAPSRPSRPGSAPARNWVTDWRRA